MIYTLALCAFVLSNVRLLTPVAKIFICLDVKTEGTFTLEEVCFGK